MRTTALKLAAAFAVAGAITVALQAPASAAEPTGLTFWTGDFAGNTASFATVGAGCTALPIAARSLWNQTSTDIHVFASDNCSGTAYAYPATEIRSLNIKGLSFKAA